MAPLGQALLSGLCAAAQLQLARSARQLAAGLATLENDVRADPICKGEVFQKWWQVGAVPTGKVAEHGTFCQSPCTSTCEDMLQAHVDFKEFLPMEKLFQISDWGEADRCSYLFGNSRHRCRIVITDPEAANEALGKLKAASEAQSPLHAALSKGSMITQWMATARQNYPKASPSCGCSFCAASLMPMILSDAGYEYAVVEQNPTCTSKRGVAYTCAQYLAESVCTCAQCFGGSDEDAGGKFLLGFTEYASDVAFAMRDLMESSDLGKDTCGGSCMYSRRDFKGQQ